MDIDEHALASSIWSLGQSVGAPESLQSIGISEEQIPPSRELPWPGSFQPAPPGV
jgi:hypothetical protein